MLHLPTSGRPGNAPKLANASQSGSDVDALLMTACRTNQLKSSARPSGCHFNGCSSCRALWCPATDSLQDDHHKVTAGLPGCRLAGCAVLQDGIDDVLPLKPTSLAAERPSPGLCWASRMLSRWMCCSSRGTQSVAGSSRQMSPAATQTQRPEASSTSQSCTKGNPLKSAR